MTGKGEKKSSKAQAEVLPVPVLSIHRSNIRWLVCSQPSRGVAGKHPGFNIIATVIRDEEKADHCYHYLES